MAISLKSNSDGVSGTIQVNGTDAITFNQSGVQNIREARAALAGTAIDVQSASVFTKTITGVTSFTVTNVPTTGTVCTFMLDLTNGGAYAITWWSGVKWSGGLAPSLTISGRDMLSFITHDGGTTWNGMLVGRDLK